MSYDYKSKKTEIGQLIKERTVNLQYLMNKINKFDALKILYSILDASDSEITSVLRKMEIENKREDSDTQISYSGSLEHLSMVVYSINHLLKNCKNQKSTLHTIPGFTTVVFTSNNPTFPGIDTYLSEYFQLDSVKIFHEDYQIPGMSEHYRRCYVLTNPDIFSKFNQVEYCLQLIGNIWSIHQWNHTLAKLTKHEKGVNVSFFSSDADSVLSHQGISLRTNVEDNRFPSWRLALIEKRKIALETTDQKRKTSKNVSLLLSNFDHEIQEFCNFPNFETHFFTSTNFIVDDYSKITRALLNLALTNKGNTTVLISKSRLIKYLIENTSCKPEIILQFLKKFTNTGGNIFEKPIIYDGTDYSYNWYSALYPFSEPYHECFDHMVDNDLKGKEFEKEVRLIFKNMNEYVANDRIDINLEFPEDIWGYKKTKTDVDVFGKYKNLLFVLECKTRKISSSKQIKLINYCEKYYQELLVKTKWVSKNFATFSELVSKQGDSVPADCKFVVPLFVSNFVGLQNENFKTLNVSELSDLLNNKKFEISDNLFKVSLNPSMAFDVPIFKIC